ncbi:MAG: hypothetical protein INH37_14760 [Myxococcaceae bacterium]|nr:hypothetical protein [Myxococcaceae bacterium]
MSFDDFMARLQARREAEAAQAAQQQQAPAAPVQAQPVAAPQAPQQQPPAQPEASQGGLGAVARDVGMGLTEAPQAAVRGGLGAITEIGNALNSAGNWLNEKVPLNVPVPQTGIKPVDAFVENPVKAIADAFGYARNSIAPTTTVTGELVEDVSQFLAGFGVMGRFIKGGAWALHKAGVKGALSAAAPATTGGRVALEVSKEAGAGALAFDPHEERLSNLIQQYPSLANPVTAFLAADKDDGEAFARLKSALENGGLAFVAERVATAIRSLKKAREGDIEGAADDALKAGKDEPTPDTIGVEYAPGTDPAVRITVERQTSEQIDTTTTSTRDWVTDTTTTRVRDRGVEPNQPIGPDDYVVRGESLKPVVSEEALVDRFGEFFSQNGIRMGDTVPAEMLDEIDRNVGNRPGDLQATYAALTTTFEKFYDRVRGPRLSEDQWKDEAERLASRFSEMTGGDMQLLLQQMGGTVAEMRRASVKMAAWMATHELSLRRLERISKMFFANDASAFNGDQEALLKAALAELSMTLRLGAYDEALGSNAARLMRARQVGIDTSGVDLGPLERPDGDPAVLPELSQGEGVDRTTTTTRRVTNNSKTTKTEREGIRVSTRRSFVDIPAELFEKIIGEQASSIDREELRKLLYKVNLARNPKAKHAVLQDAAGPGLMNVHNEYWINALLSGPKTHVVNVLGGILNSTVIQPVERMVAGAIRLDPALAREGVDQYVGMVSQLRESIGLAWQALKNDAPILDNNLTVDATTNRAIAADTFGIEPETTAAWLVNALGKMIRLPTRLMAAEDELLKQLNYRGRVYALASREAREMGLEGDAFAKHVAAVSEASYDSITGKATNEAALEFAQRATWTNDMVEGGIGETVHNAVIKHPTLRVILPFVRTPVNLFKDAAFHTPVVAPFMREFREELAAGGERRAMALAKITTGSALWATAISLAQEGVITGSGPSDPKLRAQLGESWQPNSIRVTGEDGTVKYIQFSRLDPFAQFFQMAATFHELSGEMGDKDIEEFAVASIGAMSKMLQDKTFLSGIVNAVNLFSQPETRGEAGLRRHMASYIPAIQNNFKGDEWLRAPQSVLDAQLARTPGYGTVDPRFNVLGEPVLAPGGWGPDWLSPFATREVKPDAVRDELARVAKLHRTSFSAPAKDIRVGRGGGSMDLTEFRTPDGMTAFGRYQQIVGEVRVNGKTLREELDRLVKSPEYARLTDGNEDFDGTKVRAIQRVVGRYRQFAFDALRKELPEVDAEYKRLMQARRDVRRPQQPELLPQQ